MGLQYQKKRRTRNFQNIQILLFFQNFVLSLKKERNRLNQIFIIFQTNTEKRGFFILSKRKTSFSFKKATQPLRKIEKCMDFLRPLFLRNVCLIFIFEISFLNILCNSFSRKLKFFGKSNLKSQTRSQRRIFSKNLENFFSFFFIGFNPKNKFFIFLKSNISNLKIFLQKLEHFHIPRTVFQFENKTILQFFLTPMIYLNTSITIYYPYKKSFQKVVLVSWKKEGSSLIQKYFIMLCNINPSICKNNSSLSTNSEQYQESQSKQHRCCQPQASTIQCSKPTENFNTSRHSNNHCCTCKVCTGINVKSYGIHVMCPHQETKNCNCTHSIHHSYISKNRFTCKKTLYMTHNTKCWQNLDINFRVSKKPEQMLIKNNITSTCRQKERSIKVTICKKHSQSCCKNRKTSNLQNANKANRPNKQWQAVQGHPLSSHICNCNKKVNTSLNTSNTRNVKTKNCQINRCSRVTLCTTKRRVCSPSYPRTLLNQSTLYLESESHRKK